jgi:hypothetical protein
MYYSFRQNNSGGRFQGPANTVWVEADSAEEANNIFTTLDNCYFDPDFQFDCGCCRARWYEADEQAAKSHYDMLREIDRDINSEWKSMSDLIGRNKIPQHMVRHKNGTVQFI